VSAIGNDMHMVPPKTWKVFEGGCFTKSVRRTSDWIYSGVDRQLSLMQDSDGRLSARREEALQAGSAHNSMVEEPPAGVQARPDDLDK